MTKKPNHFFLIILSAIILSGIVLLAGIQLGWFEAKPHAAPNLAANKPKEEARNPDTKTLSDALGLSEDEMVEVGGVMRPKRDVQNSDSKNEPSEKKKPSDWADAGRSPLLKGDENGQVAKLFEELKQDKPPKAAQSLLFAPEPFDLKAYQKAPQEYLGKIRPGRVFQSAQPGPDAPPIKPASSMYTSVLQGEKVVLKVKVKPKMPVTFHVQELGEFENRLKTISVAANDEGIAEANYLAGKGTLGLINILAASPVHAEDVHFIVDVSLPN